MKKNNLFIKSLTCAMALSMVLGTVTGCTNKSTGSEYAGTVVADHGDDEEETKEPNSLKKKINLRKEAKDQVSELDSVDRENLDIVIDTKDKSIFKKGTSVLSFNYSQIRLMGDSKTKYKSLNASVKKINKKYKKSVNKRFKSLKKSSVKVFNVAKKTKKGLKEYLPSDYAEELSVERADDKILSFKNEVSSYYTGANHPVQSTECNNISSKTGKTLNLKDVIKSEYADYTSLSKILTEKLRERYPKKGFYGDDDKKLAKNVKTTLEKANKGGSANWVINSQEIIFYFDPYTIDGYAAGRYSVVLSFVKDNKYINDDYLESVNNFTRILSTNESEYVDFDQNGKYDRLQVKSSYSKYYDISKITVAYQKGKKSIKVNGYSMESIVLHSKKFGNFVYVDLHQDNDYESIYIFKISTNKVKYVGSIDCGFDSWYDNGTESKRYPTDTDNFSLYTRMYALSTYSASRDYVLTSSGKPKALTKYYEVKDDRKLTLKRKLKCNEVNLDKNEVTKKATLQKGQKVYIYRTDGETYVDLADKSRTKGYRVYIRDDAEGSYVNDLNIYDVFKGMIFAG
ncbi:MAG: RsiV family protein [Lachnospiraceae bacterium]|nr:RsiV family protein [Lachnospiraceae bacterium]